MHFTTPFLVASLAASAIAVGTPHNYVSHEKRHAPTKKWVKRGEIAPNAILPVRIGLVQPNIENGRGAELLDEM